MENNFGIFVFFCGFCQDLQSTWGKSSQQSCHFFESSIHAVPLTWNIKVQGSVNMNLFTSVCLIVDFSIGFLIVDFSCGESGFFEDSSIGFAVVFTWGESGFFEDSSIGFAVLFTWGESGFLEDFIGFAVVFTWGECGFLVDG